MISERVPRRARRKETFSNVRGVRYGRTTPGRVPRLMSMDELGVVIRGRDSVEMFACVDEGGGYTELGHMFEHDAVVGGVEGAF